MIIQNQQHKPIMFENNRNIMLQYTITKKKKKENSYVIILFRENITLLLKI